MDGKNRSLWKTFEEEHAKGRAHFGIDTGIVRQTLQKRGKNKGNRASPTGWRSGTFNR
jgi:hypothetical protein